MRSRAIKNFFSEKKELTKSNAATAGATVGETVDENNNSIDISQRNQILFQAPLLIVSSGCDAEAIEPLDNYIKKLNSKWKNVSLVMSSEGDEILSRCEQHESIDLVFDPNYAGDLFSSVKAGLISCQRTSLGAWILPLASAHNPAFVEGDALSSWIGLADRLLSVVLRQPPDPTTDLILFHEGHNPIYPIWVTPSGVLRLRAISADRKWLNEFDFLVQKLEIPDRVSLQSDSSAA
jgi:hypothetical protein